jgi:hypothetical protein
MHNFSQALDRRRGPFADHRALVEVKKLAKEMPGGV